MSKQIVNNKFQAHTQQQKKPITQIINIVVQLD